MAVSRKYKETCVYMKVKKACNFSDSEWAFVAFDVKRLSDRDLDIYYYNRHDDVSVLVGEMGQVLYEQYSDAIGKL